MSHTTLISCAELNKHLQDPTYLVIDTHFNLMNTSEGLQQYQASHIPGAIYAHLDNDLSSPIIPSVTGRHPLPTVEQLTATLSQWGVDKDVQVVVYDSAGGTLAARLWWMLRWLGHKNVAVLNGGWQAWLKEDYETSTAVSKRKARTFTAHLQDDAQLSVEALISLKAKSEITLLDARAADRFRGENEGIDPIAGHIPGAISAPCMDNLTSDGYFQNSDQLAERYQQLLGEYSSSQAVCYCGSGVTAAHTILAMEHAGLPGARLYAGSWSHWITDPTRPVAKG